MSNHNDQYYSKKPVKSYFTPSEEAFDHLEKSTNLARQKAFLRDKRNNKHPALEFVEVTLDDSDISDN